MCQMLLQVMPEAVPAPEGQKPKVPQHKPAGARWPQELRKLSATAICGVLTTKEKRAITGGGELPKDKKGQTRMRQAYAAVYKDVLGYLRETDVACGIDAEVSRKALPTATACRKVVKRCTLHLLQQGDFKVRPSLKKGHKDKKRKPILKELYQVLKDGYTCEVRGRMPFTNLKDATERSPDAKRLFESLKVKSLSTAWKPLTEKYPDVHKGKLAVKKLRDNASVQVCNRTFRGTWNLPSLPSASNSTMAAFHVSCCAALRQGGAR